MTPFLALALLLASATATRDDGAEGCMAYGVFTDLVTVDGDTSFTVPAARDGFAVTAVVIGDQSDPVRHEVVAPAVSGDIITVGYYIDHVHVCLAQTPSPEESWPATTSTVTPAPTSPSSVSPVTSFTTTAPVIGSDAKNPTSTSSPTESSTTTTETSVTMRPASATPSPRSLPVTGPGDTVLPWAVLVTAAGGLLAMASRRRA